MDMDRDLVRDVVARVDDRQLVTIRKSGLQNCHKFGMKQLARAGSLVDCMSGFLNLPSRNHGNGKSPVHLHMGNFR